MFKAEVRSEILKEVVSIVQTLVDEAKFSISPDGIHLKAVDPAHVAMVELTLKTSAFDSFSATDVELGIDLNRLNDVLKLASAGELISMEQDEEQNRLILRVANITRRMALVDTTGMADPKLPNLALPVKLIIKASELGRGIKASEPVSDHISLLATPDGFELVSEGDTDVVNQKWPKSRLELLECPEAVKSMFSLDYFANMVKSIGSAELVTMNLGSDYPVRLEFDIAQGKGHVKYLLAPRIESE